jgi:hypothetical protein
VEPDEPVLQVELPDERQALVWVALRAGRGYLHAYWEVSREQVPVAERRVALEGAEVSDWPEQADWA